MTEKIWTGKRCIVMDNVTQIEVFKPGEYITHEYVENSGGRSVEIYNESTVLKVHTVRPYSEYEDGYILLEGSEVEHALVHLGATYLCKMDTSLNADLEERKAEKVRLYEQEEKNRANAFYPTEF